MSEPLVIKKKGEDGYKVFSVRGRGDIVKRVDEMAAATNHSRNELIGKCRFVNDALHDWGKKKAPV